MKQILYIGLLGLAACSAAVPDYKSMSEEQQQAYMAKHQKEMMKIYSGANAAGQIKTEITADAKTDTITSLMTMNMDARGAAGDAMAKQISDMMLEDNCTRGFMNEYVEAGITYRLKMVDKTGKTMVNLVVSPKTCAKFLG